MGHWKFSYIGILRFWASYNGILKFTNEQVKYRVMVYWDSGQGILKCRMMVYWKSPTLVYWVLDRVYWNARWNSTVYWKIFYEIGYTEIIGDRILVTEKSHNLMRKYHFKSARNKTMRACSVKISKISGRFAPGRGILKSAIPQIPDHPHRMQK